MTSSPPPPPPPPPPDFRETAGALLSQNTEGAPNTTQNLAGTLAYIRQEATTSHQKGAYFEELVRRVLMIDPTYNHNFTKVQRFSDWARRKNRDATDLGVDLVGTGHQGEVWAIQCKCYDPDSVIPKSGVDSFLAESSKNPFTHRMLVHTAKFGPNTSKIIINQSPRVTVVDFMEVATNFSFPDPGKLNFNDLKFTRQKRIPRDYQKEALQKIKKGFRTDDQGQCIMACGTGKTLVGLHTAENFGKGARILYLVPSISLFAQTMREWAADKNIPHRYLGICSDPSAGKKGRNPDNTFEDAPIEELAVPVTTDPRKVRELLENPAPDKLNITFCTYQSLNLVATAIKNSKKNISFALAICDEAHRTAGKAGSEFTLIHNKDAIPAAKRLFMTATPRIFASSSTETDSISMDDRKKFGHVFYRLSFGEAIDKGYLCDYKIITFGIREDCVTEDHQKLLDSSKKGEIKLSDTASILGCWQALKDPTDQAKKGEAPTPLRKAIAFCGTIANSRRLQAWLGPMVKQIEPAAGEKLEIRHIDGTVNAFNRKIDIEWLGQSEASNNICKVLSNARCLTEGVDVPALDAVLFMTSKKSKRDIVQSVGRVMRKSPGKTDGYVIVPVAVTAGTTPEEALEKSDRFQVLWDVVSALRSHDERLAHDIEMLRMNGTSDRILVNLPGDYLPPTSFDIPPEMIHAKLVEKCGDRKYWKQWAEDISKDYSHIQLRIRSLLGDPRNQELQEHFNDFISDLRENINDSVSEEEAASMLAQHILTAPVFEALFEEYSFAEKNPISKSLSELARHFNEFGLAMELRDMESFYRSVRNQVRGLETVDDKQKILKDLYENFFKNALKDESKFLGVVYTPNEIVDFILHSVNDAMKREFGRTLSDENVNILDPFTGTGTFWVQLMKSGLIKKEDLKRKYLREMYANEYTLLAYYIACVNIEMVWHSIMQEKEYTPFKNISLTDTFALTDDSSTPPQFTDFLEENNARLKRQKETPVTAIVGNPPWGSKNKTSDYRALSKRIDATYKAEMLKATNDTKHHLLDRYKLAIRWASDRIGENGVVGFITNGGWLEKSSDSGIRACLKKEFSSVHIMNLRGDGYKAMKGIKTEGENVFPGIKTGSAIIILIKNAIRKNEEGTIFYYETPDNMKRLAKLDLLKRSRSILEMSASQTITPTKNHQWFNSGSSWPKNWVPVISKEGKSGKAHNVIFRLYSNGYLTGQDENLYDFSKPQIKRKAKRLVSGYSSAVQDLKQQKGVSEEIAKRHSAGIVWNDGIRRKLLQQKAVKFAKKKIVKCNYRPFVKMYFYKENDIIARRYQMQNIFPDDMESQQSENTIICISTSGAFSVLAANHDTDFHFFSEFQCLPRWDYSGLGDQETPTLLDTPVSARKDNITGFAIQQFQNFYRNPKITGDDIFAYVYGVLHSPHYRARFKNNLDLNREFPRVPFAPDFCRFVEVGKTLMDLHLNYETGPRYSLGLKFSTGKDISALCFTNKSQTLDPKPDLPPNPDGTRDLIINPDVILKGIPEKAFDYTLNGRSSVKWLMVQYRIGRPGANGPARDPNAWYKTPEEILAAYERIVHLSLETVKIVESLPDPMER